MVLLIHPQDFIDSFFKQINSWKELDDRMVAIGPWTKGTTGTPGLGEINGTKGEKRELGLPGSPGLQGLNGTKGEQGETGQPGNMGQEDKP